MDKLACRTFGIIWFLYGTFRLVASAFLLFWAEFLDSFEPPPNWQPVLPGTFLIVVPFATIVIAVGVYAYLRRISAMMVGCLVWMFPVAAVVMYDQLPVNKQTFWLFNEFTDLFSHIWVFWLWLTTVIANVSLTAIAAAARHRSRSVRS
jgi:hypothetical protein